jgi:glutamyl-tRNA synthetase
VTQLIEAAGDRIKVAGDVLDYDEFFVADDKFVYDLSAFEKRIVKPAGAVELLAKFRMALAGVEPFTAADLETWLHEWVAAQGIKLGDVVHAVRVAVTGKAVGFGLYDTLAILGRERCLARIDRAIDKARRDKPAG